MIAFNDAHRSDYALEPIRKLLPIAPSTYYEHKARKRDPARRLAREKRDAQPCPEIRRVHREKRDVYSTRNVLKQLHREDIDVGKCTVDRPVKQLGLRESTRGDHKCKTILPDALQAKPRDLVTRSFEASRPNALWLADTTYVPTRHGIADVAFVIDAYARMMVGWRVTRSLNTELVLNALEQVNWARGKHDGLLPHSDHGYHYLSIPHNDRLVDAGIDASVGSVGYFYDNALSETINGLHKTGVNHRGKPWRTVESVEHATLEWVDWYDSRRLFEPLNHVLPKSTRKPIISSQRRKLRRRKSNPELRGERGAIQGPASNASTIAVSAYISSTPWARDHHATRLRNAANRRTASGLRPMYCLSLR
jgi:putative transposase